MTDTILVHAARGDVIQFVESLKFWKDIPNYPNRLSHEERQAQRDRQQDAWQLWLTGNGIEAKGLVVQYNSSRARYLEMATQQPDVIRNATGVILSEVIFIGGQHAFVDVLWNDEHIRSHHLVTLRPCHRLDDSLIAAIQNFKQPNYDVRFIGGV